MPSCTRVLLGAAFLGAAVTGVAADSCTAYKTCLSCVSDPFCVAVPGQGWCTKSKTCGESCRDEQLNQLPVARTMSDCDPNKYPRARTSSAPAAHPTQIPVAPASTVAQVRCLNEGIRDCDGNCLTDANCNNPSAGISRCTQLYTAGAQVCFDGVKFAGDGVSKPNFNCPRFSCSGMACKTCANDNEDKTPKICASGLTRDCNNVCLSDTDCSFVKLGVSTCAQLGGKTKKFPGQCLKGHTSSDNGAHPNFNCPWHGCNNGDCSPCGPNPGADVAAPATPVTPAAFATNVSAGAEAVDIAKLESEILNLAPTKNASSQSQAPALAPVPVPVPAPIPAPAPAPAPAPKKAPPARPPVCPNKGTRDCNNRCLTDHDCVSYLYNKKRCSEWIGDGACDKGYTATDDGAKPNFNCPWYHCDGGACGVCGNNPDVDVVEGSSAPAPMPIPLPYLPPRTAPSASLAPVPEMPLVAALEELSKMHEKGELSSQEFAEAKAKLLGGAPSGSTVAPAVSAPSAKDSVDAKAKLRGTPAAQESNTLPAQTVPSLSGISGTLLDFLKAAGEKGMTKSSLMAKYLEKYGSKLDPPGGLNKLLYQLPDTHPTLDPEVGVVRFVFGDAAAAKMFSRLNGATSGSGSDQPA